MAGGRPPTDWEKAYPILINAFQNGLNIMQACLQADISRETYRLKCEADESFLAKMETAQQRSLIKARQNIVAAVEAGDKDLSKWYLERKDRDFKPKTDITSDD